MRILFAITVFLPSRIYGGPATVAMNQARELVKRGHDVTVITSDVISMRPPEHAKEHESVMDGVRIKYFPTRILAPRFPALVSMELRKWLKEGIHRYDAVHIHFARDWIPVTVAREAVKRRAKVFLQPHGMLSRTDGARGVLDWFIIKNILQGVRAVIALQETEMRNVASIAPRAKTYVVPNGVAVSLAGRFWSVDTLTRKTVLFLARLHPRKRVMDVIDAAKILLSAGESIRLRIVGPDEGDLQRAQQRVRELRLCEVVEFVGALPSSRVAEEFLNASIYVLPSVDEPFPMTVVEAMAIGVPTIVTEQIHIRDLLMRRNAAMVVRPNPSSIAAGIEHLFANPDAALKLSDNGRGLVRDELTIDKVVTRLEQLYRG